MRKIVIFICILSLFLIIIYPTNVRAVQNADDIFTKADEFLEIGGGQAGISEAIDEDTLGDTSDFLYNILLGIGMIIAVIVGMVLGIKYMMATSEDKAEIKQTLPAYIVACVVIFGAFVIWRLVINVIQ